VPYKLSFKKIAEQVDIGDVAKLCNLVVTKDRATCPVCDSERSIQLFAETNSFRCHSAEISGDCISLYAHLNGTGMYAAAKSLQEQFGTADAARPATSPTSPAGGPVKSQPASTNLSADGHHHREPVQKLAKVDRTFDAAAFAARLAYTEEVSALGISPEDASRLGIGFHAQAGLLRNRVCFPIRNEDGTIAGYIGVQGADVKVPTTWLPPKVVQLRRRA
jgi:hypothetical protein